MNAAHQVPYDRTSLFLSRSAPQGRRVEFIAENGGGAGVRLRERKP